MFLLFLFQVLKVSSNLFTHRVDESFHVQGPCGVSPAPTQHQVEGSFPRSPWQGHYSAAATEPAFRMVCGSRAVTWHFCAGFVGL